MDRGLFTKPKKIVYTPEEVEEHQKVEREQWKRWIKEDNIFYNYGTGKTIPEVKDLDTKTLDELKTIHKRYENNPGIALLKKFFANAPDGAVPIGGYEKIYNDAILKVTDPGDGGDGGGGDGGGGGGIETVFDEKYKPYYKEPLAIDIKKQTAYLKSILSDTYPDYTKADWEKMATTELVRSAQESAVSDFDAADTRGKISEFIADMPESYKTQEADIASRMGEYAGKTFKEQYIPAITQSYGARGLSAGTSLDSALSRQAGQLQGDIQGQLAPNAINSYLQSQGLTLENLYGEATRQGLKGSDAVNYARGLLGNAMSNLGSAAGANLAGQWNTNLANLGYGNQMNLLNRQGEIQSDIAQQQSGGNLLGGLIEWGLNKFFPVKQIKIG